MVAIAHSLAITLYVGAAALAAAPFARPVAAPVRGVVALLAAAVAMHTVALVEFARAFGVPPLTGIGPAFSFAAFLLGITLLLVEVTAREVSLTLVAAPLAALLAAVGTIAGMVPGSSPSGLQGAWLAAHIAASFVGIASFATAAAAGAMYLVERRELRSRRFGAIFRFFPPLETLDRVNHVAVVGGWLALTVGVVLAVAYSIQYRALDTRQVIWGLAAWSAVTTLTAGRVVGGWRAKRAAVLSGVSFLAVAALYVAFRMTAPLSGQFL